MARLSLEDIMRFSHHITLAALLPVVAILLLAAGAGAYVLGGGLGLIMAFLVGGAVFAWAGRSLATAIRRLTQQLEEEGAREPAAPFAGSRVVELRALDSAWSDAARRIDQVFAAQRDFTANAAHELRTPLAALQVAGESALRALHEGDTAARDAIGAMLEEAERAGNLVDRLLLLARAESGNMPVEARQMSVRELVEPVVEWLRPLAEERGQTLAFETQEDWSVWLDENLLRMALENLISNAIRYSPPRSAIIVRAGRRAEGGVALDVLDEGPGIEPQDVQRLFDRFFRGVKGTKGGSGLGLPIARWAVDAFGGRLEYERRIGQGSLFRICCPETEWDHFGDIAMEQGAADPIAPDWIAAASPRQVLARLQTRRSGLSETDATERRERYGPNRLRGEQAPSIPLHLLRAAWSPFNGVLAVSILLSLVLAEPGPAIVMSAMIVLSTGLRFLQERRAFSAIERLEDLVAVKAEVSRPEAAAPMEIPAEDLCLGDLVHLAPGDMVPADLRLISASGLLVSEMTFTGESLPLQKTTATTGNAATNLCYMGTHVVSGGGRGVVYATGHRTRLGMSSRLLDARRPPTAFERGVTRVSWLLLGTMAVLVPLVFLINGALKGNWTEALLFGLAVAVGLTPELLPMIVNINLARAANVLARRGIIMKSLPAVHDLGAMNVLCVDKTGTLTEDAPVFENALNADGQRSAYALEAAMMNARLQASLRSTLDTALLHHAGYQPVATPGTGRIGEIPFDYERRRVSVWQPQSKGTGGRLICKGAAESVLQVCAQYRTSAQEVRPLDNGARNRISEHLHAAQQQGYRVLAVAERVGVVWPELPTAALEADMTFLGLLLFKDPLKSGAKALIEAIESHGLQVKLLTGDHMDNALDAARRAGIGETALTGESIERMDDSELRVAVSETDVFARLDPLDKARVVRALREAGYRVGFLGEGANDANALREADVGIATESAADLSRDCADVILTRKDLASLRDAVQEGRAAFGNMLKYIKITASSNFGNAVSVVIASLILPFLPMRAVHLLIQNLLYDIAQFALPWDRVDGSFTDRPRPWSADSIGRFMGVFGPVSCVFDLLTFAVLWYGFGANRMEQAALFHTGWFTVGLLTQLMIVHVLRTGGVPFVKEWATRPVWLAGLLALAVGIALPYTPLAGWIGMVELPLLFYGWVALVLVSYAAMAQWAKTRYIRWTGQWL